MYEEDKHIINKTDRYDTWYYTVNLEEENEERYSNDVL